MTHIHEILAYLAGVLSLAIPLLLWQSRRLQHRERELERLYQGLIDLIREDFVAKAAASEILQKLHKSENGNGTES